MKPSIADVCLLIVTGCASFFLVEGGLLLREARVKVDVLATEYARLIEPGMKAEASLAAAGITLAQVGAKERSAFDAQQKYFVKLSDRTDTLFSSMNQTVEGVNDEILPRIRENLESTNALVDNGDLGITDLRAALRDGRVNARNLSASANSFIGDLRPAVENFNGAAKNGFEISANLDSTTKDVADFVHRETTPVRGMWNIIKAFLKTFAGPLAQTATAIK